MVTRAPDNADRHAQTDMPDEAVRRVGRRACPDGPEERDISDTFKLTTRHPARSRPATPERRA